MRIAGHPLHPMVVHFPIAAWAGTVGMDFAYRIWELPILAIAGFGCLAAGLALGAITILAGFVDYAAMAAEHPAQKTAVGHMWIMSSDWMVFAISLALRGFGPQTALSAGIIGTDVVGLILMILGAWLGGTLVYGFGIGVRPIEQREREHCSGPRQQLQLQPGIVDAEGSKRRERVHTQQQGGPL